MKAWNSVLFVAGAVACVAACEPPAQAPGPVIPVQPEATFPTSGPAYWVGKCRGGDGEICRLVGLNYRKGDSGSWGYFPKDEAKAAAAFEAGCKFGSNGACGELGRVLRKGIGIQQDETRAAELVVRSCEGGYEWACVDAGIVLYDGSGIQTDREHASRDLKGGCAMGNSSACELLHDLFGTEQFSTTNAPIGAAGIAFGQTVSEVDALCKASGNKGTPPLKTPDLFYNCFGSTTSELPDVRQVSAKMCDGRVCSISISIPLSAGERWVGRFTQLEKNLTGRYGPAHERRRIQPSACESAKAFPACLADKTVTYSSRWVWSTPEVAVGIDLYPTASGPPNIALTYLTGTLLRQPTGL